MANSLNLLIYKSMVMHSCNLSTWEVEVRERQIGGEKVGRLNFLILHEYNCFVVELEDCPI